MVPALRAVGAALCCVLSVAACGGGDGDRSVRVAAASSLTEVVDALDELLDARGHDLEVEADLSGSANLARQLLDGAPADVFLAADEATMATLVEGGLAVGDVVDLATNRLVIAVPKGNPGGVEDLDDLARSELLVGRCADAVPCGRLALDELDESAIDDRADTEEPNVRSLLAKVAAGELDAALVYATDVRGRNDVVAIDDPRLDRVNRYQAVVVDGGDEVRGRRVIDALRSPAGVSLLAALGFGPP